MKVWEKQKETKPFFIAKNERRSLSSWPISVERGRDWKWPTTTATSFAELARWNGMTDKAAPRWSYRSVLLADIILSTKLLAIGVAAIDIIIIIIILVSGSGSASQARYLIIADNCMRTGERGSFLRWNLHGRVLPSLCLVSRDWIVSGQLWSQLLNWVSQRHTCYRIESSNHNLCVCRRAVWYSP